MTMPEFHGILGFENRERWDLFLKKNVKKRVRFGRGCRNQHGTLFRIKLKSDDYFNFDPKECSNQLFKNTLSIN